MFDPDHLEEIREATSRGNGETLGRIRATARGEANHLAPLIAAVKTSATVGEICGVPREEFGEHWPGSAV